MMKRLTMALVGAAALLGVAAPGASAKVDARNDTIVAVQGSTIRIDIRTLLANDRALAPNRPRGLTFRGVQAALGGSQGIQSLTFNRNTRRVIVVLNPSFTGITSFRYTISGTNRPSQRDTASVFLQVASPT